MAEEVVLSIEETNEIRRKLGLPLITPNLVRTDPLKPEHKQAEVDREGIVQQIEEIAVPILDKTRGEGTVTGATYDDNSQFIDRRVLQLKKRISERRTKPLLNLDDEDEDDWLENISTKRTRNTTVRPMYDEDAQEQLQEFRVSHTSSVLAPGKDVVMTLKETSVLDEGEEVLLENEAIRHDEEVKMNMELRQLNRERKLNKSALNDPSKIAKYADSGLRTYSDHGSFKISTGSVLLDDGTKMSDKIESLDGKRKLDLQQDEEIAEAAGDYEPIKIKKRRKPQNSSMIRKKDRSAAPVKVQLVDEDELMENEDEHFYSNLSISKVTKERSIEKLVEEAYEERAERKQRTRTVDLLRNGVVIDETDLFLDSLKDDILGNESTSRAAATPAAEAHNIPNTPAKASSVLKLASESKDGDNNTPNFYAGLGSTLQYLKEKNLFSDASTSRTSVDQKKQELLRIQQRIAAREVGERIDSQFASAGSLSQEDQKRLDQYKEDEIMRAAAPFQRERVAGYNPNVTLTYKDNSGRPLNAKEAFKKISQAWSGARASRKLASHRRRDQNSRE
ncbi:FAFR327Cp [Eremothecium gossypii FDAG1]|nr:FAFR327Cp [Eremothecium gossypii FDAG1]